MIIYDYPSEESYWKHKLSKANSWLKKYPTSKTKQKRKIKCENMLEEVFKKRINYDTM